MLRRNSENGQEADGSDPGSFFRGKKKIATGGDSVVA
jgi:hypothetical protein